MGMQEFKKRRKLKKLLYSKLTLFLLVALCALMARATWSVYKKSTESAAIALQSQAQYESLAQKRKALSENIDRLKTPEGVEAEVRNKYNVVKPEEKLVVIVDSTSSTSPAASSTSVWARILNFFGL